MLPSFRCTQDSLREAADVKKLVKQIAVDVPRFLRQLLALSSSEGVQGIVRRIRSKLARIIEPTDVVMEVRLEDVLATNMSRLPIHSVPAIKSLEPIVLNWVMGPSNPGSGGHTTAFRVINYLEAHGYRNRLYFYDVYGGDHKYYADIVRSYFKFQGPISRVQDGMSDAHGVVATSWSTAYPVVSAISAGKRFYFVQDFEPYFYPVGTSSTLAENTYRMGLYGITAGRWLTQKLESEFKMRSDYFDFGCDTGVYHRIPEAKRSGIVFYARPGTARRAFELGLMAIEAFATRRPDIAIHFYGNRMGRLSFPFINHGTVTPATLNSIYNQCFAGLSLSMTNVSLVPQEMLAAGCIPVVNDAFHNRIVLNNDHVQYAAPDPHALASALEAVTNAADFEAVSIAASSSVRSANWDAAGSKVDAILRRELGLSACSELLEA